MNNELSQDRTIRDVIKYLQIEIKIYLFMYWLEIQNIIDKYLFHTKWCSEHGYECHGRCNI